MKLEINSRKKKAEIKQHKLEQLVSQRDQEEN